MSYSKGPMDPLERVVRLRRGVLVVAARAPMSARFMKPVCDLLLRIEEDLGYLERDIRREATPIYDRLIRERS